MARFFSGAQESDIAFVNDISITGSRMASKLVYVTMLNILMLPVQNDKIDSILSDIFSSDHVPLVIHFIYKD